MALPSDLIDGTMVEVVGREELIRLKRASGRPQDCVDADLLASMADGGAPWEA
ncbi:MAG: hypothetical protein IPH07_38895 [Deltaproteobacteria bacterium]|nr:hypothetical protein [Deltaproteobacteria bacterium]MBP7291020.1 hypothetical protein [Nannocystaceae bacterium]